MYCCVAVVARRGWVGRLVRQGRWFGRCVGVGGRAGSWLCVVHVFCSFAFWTHGAFTTTTTHSTMERRVRTMDSHLLMYVIAVPRYCCSTWWVGDSLRGCVYVFAGGCVGGCVGLYLVDCAPSILCAVGGDHVSDESDLFLFWVGGCPAPLWHSSAYHLITYGW